MKDRARACAHTVASTFIDLNSLWGHQLYVSVMKQEGSQASSNSKVRKGSRAMNKMQAKCCGWRNGARGGGAVWGTGFTSAHCGNVTERVTSKQDSEQCQLVKL